jgi:uncharacterized protein (DUF2062 family)
MQSKQTESTSALGRERSGVWRGTVGRAFRRFFHWLSPFRAWRELRAGQPARRDFAAGLAVGAFIACLPIYGLQTVLSLYAARRLALHPLSVVTGSQLSAPPLGPVLAFVSLVLGHALISGKLPDLTDWRTHHLPAMSLAVFNSLFISWIVGGVVLGAVLAVIIYVISSLAFRLIFRGPDSGQ